MGEVLAVRDAYRAQERTMPMQECSTSGSTKREFYQQRETSEKSLYYWLTLLIHNSVLLKLFLFFGPLGFDSGRLMTPFRK